MLLIFISAAPFKSSNLFFLEISFCFIKADTEEGKETFWAQNKNIPFKYPVLFSWKCFSFDFN